MPLPEFSLLPLVRKLKNKTGLGVATTNIQHRRSEKTLSTGCRLRSPEQKRSANRVKVARHCSNGYTLFSRATAASYRNTLDHAARCAPLNYTRLNLLNALASLNLAAT